MYISGKLTENPGKINLVFLKGEDGKINLVKYLLKSDNFDWKNNELKITDLAVKSFRINFLEDKREKSKRIVIDGENF